MDSAPTQSLVPKIFQSLAGYDRRRFFADVIAGVTVGLVALPLAMAFAISSGVKPEAGIYTAIVAGFVVAALGGSRCQISGPTGAFVVIVAGIVAEFGVSGLLTCTAMAGVALVVMGVTGLGSAVRYIPRPVTIGFTNGIAILIASTQLKDFFGLSLDSVPSEFLPRISALAQAASTVSVTAVIVGVASMLLVLLTPKILKWAPGSIVALLVATVSCSLLNVPVVTIGDKFGDIPSGLPALTIPEFRWDLMVLLLPSAFTVAMLAAIESLLSAVVADNMSGDRHNPDAELTAQGVANLLVPLVGGIPATGAIARTATNIRSGATSPIAGMVHSATLLLVVLLAAPLARYIPLPTLAAILLVVAYRMGEWHTVPGIFRLSTADRSVWLATFLLTVFADLTLAVGVGMTLAALLYIHSVTSTTMVAAISDEELGSGELRVLSGSYVPAYCSIVRVRGPLLFGATDKLERATANLSKFGEVVILKLTYMTALDGTAIHVLESLARRLVASGRTLILCGAQPQPAKIIARSELVEIIGAKNLQPNLDTALERAVVVKEETSRLPDRGAVV